MIRAQDLITNPYPGLRPFQEEESHLFFGRERDIDELLRRFGRSRFLAVVGTSGSGKSSLVRAGLLPALHGGYLAEAGSHWRIAVFTPGQDPIANLSSALEPILHIGPMLEVTLRRSSLGLREVVRQARLQHSENVLIVVDQFEELFRFKKAWRSISDEAAAFVKLLLAAASQLETPIYVLITMRSDFLGDCEQFRDLPEIVNKSLFLVPRMTRDQLREAIAGPAAIGNARLSPALIQELLNDVAETQDDLPVLQHALMRTWRTAFEKQSESDEIEIEAADYEATGGMAAALSRHAGEAFLELPDDRHRALAKKVFQCLTEKGPDNREIRRPTRFGDLCTIAQGLPSEIRTIIDTFRSPGRAFLMPAAPEPIEENSVIDISHESLIRKWEMLREWVEEEAQSRAMYIRLAEAARFHREGKGRLWGNPELELALDWRTKEQPAEAWAERYRVGYRDTIEFLEKSEAHAKELERAERTRRAGWRLVIWVLAGFLILAVSLYFNLRAQRQVGVARSLLSQALLITDARPSKFDQAALLAIESIRLEPTMEGESILRRALTLLPAEIRRVAVACSVRNARLSPGGQFVACVDDISGSVKVFPMAAGAESASLAIADSRDITTLESSPDGKFLAAGFRDLGFKLYDSPTARLLISAADGYTTTAVTFSADGTNVAVAVFHEGNSRAGIHLLAVADGGARPRYLPIEFRLEGLAFSTDGNFLAASHEGRTSANADVTIFDLTSGRSRTIVGGAFTPSLALSAGAALIALPHTDSTVRVIDTETGKERSRLSHQMSASAVAFSRDGRYTASGSEDGTAQVMETSSGRRIGLVPTGSPVKAVAFTTGNNLVVLSEDGTARTVDVVDKMFQGARFASVAIVAISPRARYVTTVRVGSPMFDLATLDGATGRVWQQSVTPEAVTSGVTRYSDDEKYLMMSGPEGLRIYEANTGKEITLPAGSGVPTDRVSSNGKLIVWDTPNSIEIRDTETTRQETLPVANTYLLELSPDGRFLASMSGSDPYVTVRDIDTKMELFRVETPVQQGASGINAVFSPMGRYLAISANKTLSLVKVPGGRIVWQLKDTDIFKILLFSHDDSIVAAGGGTPPVYRLIDTRAGNTLSTIQIPREVELVGAAFSVNGRYFDAADETSITRHYLRREDLIDQTCSLLIRNLTRDEWDTFLPAAPYRRTCPNLP